MGRAEPFCSCKSDARFEHARDSVQGAGPRKPFARMQRCIGKNREITVANQHRDIGAIGCRNFAASRTARKYSTSALLQQRAAATFAINRDAERGGKCRRQVYVFRDRGRDLMRKPRN